MTLCHFRVVPGRVPPPGGQGGPSRRTPVPASLGNRITSRDRRQRSAHRDGQLPRRKCGEATSSSLPTLPQTGRPAQPTSPRWLQIATVGTAAEIIAALFRIGKKNRFFFFFVLFLLFEFTESRARANARELFSVHQRSNARHRNLKIKLNTAPRRKGHATCDFRFRERSVAGSPRKILLAVVFWKRITLLLIFPSNIRRDVRLATGRESGERARNHGDRQTVFNLSVRPCDPARACGSQMEPLHGTCGLGRARRRPAAP